MAWAVFWFPFLYGLLAIGAGLCLIVGFSFFNPLFCSFLQSCYDFLLHYFAIPTVMSFGPSLLDFFGPTACSSLNDSAWSLGFIFVTLLAGSCVLFISSWASLAHLLSLSFLRPFPNSAFSWVFTNSFRLPLPNYLILHSLGLMGLPSTPYFLCLHYFEFAMAYSHFSTSHTAHRFATSLSSSSF